MGPRLLLCAAVLAWSAAGTDTPRFAPAEKSALVKTFTTSMSFASSRTKLTLDGKEIPDGSVPVPSRVQAETRRVVVTDRWVKVGDGRPLELDRTFDELVMNQKVETTAPEATEAQMVEAAQESDLEGKTVRFSWNAENSRYDTAAAGEDLDPELFVGLREDLDLRVLLPKVDVTIGDTWELDCKALNHALNPGGNLHFHEAGKEAAKRKPEQQTLSERFDENAEGKGLATLESVREKNGRRLANVKVEAHVRTHGILPEQDSMRGDIELELEGQLVWDLAANHVDSAAFTGKLQLAIGGDREILKNGAKHTMNVRSEFTGSLRFDLETKAP